MARMRFDELNKISQEEIVESQDVLNIDEFFDDMYLSESEKEERKDLAKNLFVILNAILAIIKTNQVLGNPHDENYYIDYIVSNLEGIYDRLFGKGKYNNQIEAFANDFVNTTMAHIDEPFYTSVDRATINAETQAYNKYQYDEAVRTGKKYKTWITKHDKKVRYDHQEVDGIKLPIKEPFDVGGSLLMFPTDMSLDAHLKQICNCRCVCRYDGTDEVENTEKSNDIPLYRQVKGSNIIIEPLKIPRSEKIANYISSDDIRISFKEITFDSSFDKLSFEVQKEVAQALDFMSATFGKDALPRYISVENLSNAYGITRTLYRKIILSDSLKLSDALFVTCHECCHLLDYNKGTIAESVYREAYKNLGLRENSKQLKSYLFNVLGPDLYKIYTKNKNYTEIFAWCFEDALYDSSNPLSVQVFNVTKERYSQ